MGKKRNRQLSERQLRMIELRATGKSYSEIGKAFGITASGARDNIRVAARLLMRHRSDALPPNVTTQFSVDELIASVPNIKPVHGVMAVSKPTPQLDEKVQELSVKTNLGEIVVRVKQDPVYSGVYVDLRGPGLNDKFEKNTVGLAMVEFEPDKNKIQTVVYGDGNAEDYTHLIEHENVLEQERVKTTLAEQIQTASSIAEQGRATDSAPVKGAIPER